MKKYCLHFIFVFIVFSFFVLGQKPTPAVSSTPQRTNDDSDIVKISTTLIQIDVSVTDKDGKPIKDLKPEDFEIYENKNKQKITNFSFIHSENSQSENKVLEPPTPSNEKNKKNTSIPIPPVKFKAENVRHTIAFVVDDLNLGFDGIYFIRKALKNFVDKQMQDNDLIAIIRTGTGIGALQQFTSDKRILYAAIENIRFNPNGIGGVNPFAPNKPDVDTKQTEGSKALDSAEAEYNDFRQSVFASGTLGAISYVVNAMNDLPGRKSLMLVSDGLGIKKSDGEKDENVLKALKSLIEISNRSSVVIYTMSAKGIPGDPEMTADGSSSSIIGSDLELSDKGATSNLQRLVTQANQKLDDIEKQISLVRLSKETGGLAIINQKELNTNIQMMLDDQKGYYLIGYQPDDETFDAKIARFNKLFVKVNRPDVKVRYRSGFFGLTDEQVKTNVKLSPSQQITNALILPFAKSEINIRMASLFGNGINGSYVRSFLYIQGKDLSFTEEPDGWKKSNFDIYAFIFGDNGLPIDQISKNYTFRVSPETYKEIQNSGFVYNFNMLMKKPGAYQFRVAMRDKGSEKIGSASQFIQVPDLKKKRLTLSGITLESFTLEEWQKRQQVQNSSVIIEPNTLNNIQSDTALRRFKRGLILSFAYNIYNAKIDKATNQPNLQIQMRLFHEGKLILEGTPKPIDLSNQSDLERIVANGAISLANQMQLGEYVLQIIVLDTSAHGKSTIGTQLVDFEVVE